MSALRKVEIDARFPPKYQFLFKPARYKVAKGGRGGARSWSFARALIIMMDQKGLRVLCTREVQKSIKDSVHRLLSDQIEAMGYGHAFEITQTEIRHRSSGGLFLFAGLSDQTAESIKSFEGVDVCWIEEARNVSKRSWDILLPTIRKPNSEVWISYNPELESDETHQRFAVNPPPDAVVVHCNFNDNPWFPEVLERERRHCEKTDPENYRNIWLGECKPAVEGAIYYRQVAEMESQGRVCHLPYDSMLKVHTVWDLGWNDSTAIILCQRLASGVRIIDYIEDSGRKLSDYAADLNAMNLNWGYDWLPHDGYAEDVKSKSAAAILKSQGRKVKPRESGVPNIPVEKGIIAARQLFPRVYMDTTATKRLQECLKRYRRTVPKSTGEPGDPIHDEYSHGADAFRYLALVADKLGNDDLGSKYVTGRIPYENRGIV